MNNPRFPLYIPSKGRFKNRLTSDYLSYMKVHHNIVIEEQEYKKYKLYIKDNPFINLIVLDKEYQKNYDAQCELEDGESKGSGPARNFIWDHSIFNGFKWHWIMDDNIRAFYRLNKNIKYRVSNGSIFKAMEDFVSRYTNVVMAGPAYEMFVPRKKKFPPFIYNTRLFSCNLIRNDIHFRWRCRYNEDADLSLRILKAGYCTIQFNAFLQDKVTTQMMKGGNTDEVYKNGTLEKSKMLARLHPDCTKVVWRYGRWHHHTDFSKFKKNIPIKRDDIEIKPGIDNYGMKLIHKKPAKNSP